MAFSSARTARVIYGTFPLSSYATDTDRSEDVEMLDAWTFVDDADRVLPGHRSGEFSFAGFWDDGVGAGSLRDYLNSRRQEGDAKVFSYAPAGFAVGSPVMAADAFLRMHQVNSAKSALSKIALGLRADDGLEDGVSLHDLTSISAGGNDSQVDHGASTANGGVGFLHVTAATGTDLVVKIQHASSPPTWADLVTFTSTSAVGDERIAVAAGTTVERYLRALWTVSGGDFTFQTSFARL